MTLNSGVSRGHEGMSTSYANSYQQSHIPYSHGQRNTVRPTTTYNTPTERGSGYTTPSAPRVNRFGKGQSPLRKRDRSRSPHRKDSFNSTRGYRERSFSRPYPERPLFSDPFQEVDKEHGRAEGRAFARDEYNNGRPTIAARAFWRFADVMEEGLFAPQDIDGKMILDMPNQEANTLAHNIGLYLSHIHARQYQIKFAGAKWCVKLEDRRRLIDPGVVFQVYIAENLIDRHVELDNRNRASHANGSSIHKLRTVVAVQREGDEVEVRVTTGFGQNQRPPRGREGEYALLAHENDHESLAAASEIRAIQYEGNKHLIKPTFIRLTRPTWINIGNTPIGREGRIVIDDFQMTADLLKLDDDHDFRVMGAKLAEERDQQEHDAFR